MKTKKLSKKALAGTIQTLYGKHAEGRLINIMDIGKVFSAAEIAYAIPADPAEALALMEASIIKSIETLTTTYAELNAARGAR